MTERGLPIVDGPAACPFVAFVDDRDERATSPDHRHRCYAEATPAPRALAHQEAYCLSSAFPVCPTFQDWAKREAARASSDTGPSAGSSAGSIAGQPIPGLSDERPIGGLDDDEAEPPIYEDRPRKPAGRDWKTPPPWINRAEEQAGRGPALDAAGAAGGAGAAGLAAGAAGAGAAGAAAGGGGLSGGFADRLVSPDASARQRTPVWRTGDAWDDELDEHGNPVGGDAPEPPEPEDEPVAVLEEEPPRPRRSREREQERYEDDERERRTAPSWERPARLETYPSLRSRRMGGIGIPTLALMAVAVVLAAILLFFLPGLLGLGGGQSGGSPSPSAGGASPSAAASVGPSEVPAATQQTYVVQNGDTMSKIAKKFGVPLQTLIDANKSTIPNPDKLKIGDTVIIPTAVPSALPGTSAGASP